VRHSFLKLITFINFEEIKNYNFYLGEPQDVFNGLPSFIKLDNPKSAIFILLNSLIRIFSGLRSLI
jgi:hypothetical protein